MSHAPLNSAAALAQISFAATAGHLTQPAVDNIRAWLTEPRYAEYAPEVLQLVAAERWQDLDDVFWTVIPFGTGGRRGKMFPVGSNAINDRTMGESAQGLADYVKRRAGGELSCAIAYDTRHRSRHFAELCAEIMVAAGFRVFFLDGYRSTPELSVAVRVKQCSCGVMITASHNPPSDNAIKAYWSTGGQLLPPHDKGVIDCVMNVDAIRRTPFADALANGRVVMCQDEIDAAYIDAVCAQALGGPRDVKIVYSPMHGVGASSVCPALARAGFSDVEVYQPHARPDGDFPNVPGHVSNPENPQTFDGMIARARQTGADVVLSTDPDADRLGCAAPLKLGHDQWRTFTGNQIAALLTERLLDGRNRAGALLPEHYVVKTLVTTEMIRRIADSYGVRTIGDLQVGFKWIAGVIDAEGPDKFLFGAEESHGYLVGQYARDKDAAVAALLAAELAAQCKADGKSLHEKLDDLYWQYGCHAENTVSLTMPGSEGMARMKTLMQRVRTEPPKSLAGQRVARVRDYLQLTTCQPGGAAAPLAGPRGDLVILDLERAGNYAAIRPSGTEPKVKFYLFAYEPAEQLANLEETKQELTKRLAACAADLRAFAESCSD